MVFKQTMMQSKRQTGKRAVAAAAPGGLPPIQAFNGAAAAGDAESITGRLREAVIKYRLRWSAFVVISSLVWPLLPFTAQPLCWLTQCTSVLYTALPPPESSVVAQHSKDGPHSPLADRPARAGHALLPPLPRRGRPAVDAVGARPVVATEEGLPDSARHAIESSSAFIVTPHILVKLPSDNVAGSVWQALPSPQSGSPGPPRDTDRVSRAGVAAAAAAAPPPAAAPVFARPLRRTAEPGMRVNERNHSSSYRSMACRQGECLYRQAG